MAQSELYHNNCRRCATSIMSIDMPAFKLLHWIAQWNNQRDAPPTPDQADEGAYGCTKIFSKARQLEVTIEHSDELPFGAYSHPQVRVHIVDRCTGRALCPPQMTSEAKFCMDNNANCKTKSPTKGVRFRRGKRFESVSTHDEDDEYPKSLKSKPTPDYRRIALGLFPYNHQQGNSNYELFRASRRSRRHVRVPPHRVRCTFNYEPQTRQPRQVKSMLQKQTYGSAVDNCDQEMNDAVENEPGDNQEPPTEVSPVVEDPGSKLATLEALSSDFFDLMVPCKRNATEPCLIPQRVLCSLPSGKKGCSAVSFSPCGRFLAASVSPELGDFVVQVYHMASAELFAVGRGHRGVIYSLEWSIISNGQYRLLSASSDGTVRLWELPSKNAASSSDDPSGTSSQRTHLLSLVFQWHHFPCFVYCAIFLPGSDGEIVLTGASDGCMRFRKNHQYQMANLSTECSSITSLELHPRKAHLLVHTQPNAIFQYELRSYLLLNKSYAGVACESLLVKSTFSPDGKLVISGSEDGVPRLFTSLHGQQLQRGVWGTHFFHGCPVLDVSWSPTAHMAALCSYGGNNPIVVLCSYRGDEDAVYMDESAASNITTNTTTNFQLAVDAFRGANQLEAVSCDHAQRLQRALERRQKRLQAKAVPYFYEQPTQFSLVTLIHTTLLVAMSSGSKLREDPRHHKNKEAIRHLSQSQLEILTLASIFHETGGRIPNDRGKATTWTRQSGWDKILEVSAALKNGGMSIPKITTMQAFFPPVFGVKWERNHIVAIDLSDNGLSGTFPAKIVRLRFLTTLKMRNNPNLRGPLPREIYSMPHLKYCYIDGTKVENALPFNIAHSFEITQTKPESGRSSKSAVSTVSFCTGNEHLIRWMADMTEAEMYMVHSTLKKLHESTTGQAGRQQIKCTASNATGPERAAAAIKLQRIYRARIERTKFRDFLHSLIEMKVDPTTGYTYYVNARTGEATWDKPKFLGSDIDSDTNTNKPSNNAEDAREAWKPYDDGYGNAYYWNSVTGESSWEPPTFLSRIYEELRERYGADKTDDERFELFFQDIDRDGTGEIDQDEFARLCGDLGMALSAKQIKEVFQELDSSGDGQLDRPEIIAWLTRNFK
ncbi:Leucine-rich repeat domain, L domain-like [Phytophthora cactorum]|nr:Leucine-rich repeat domain, L domain-like [Phytophthora cactorum]